MRKDHRLIGATLSVSVRSTWSSLGPDRILELIHRADAERPGLRIAWVHRDGRPSTGPPLFAQPALDGLHTIDQQVLADSGSAERQYLVTRVPVRNGTELLGAIEIAETMDARDRYIRSSIWNTVLATLAMIVVSGAGVVIFGLWLVGKPLRLLAAKAKRVGQGDLGGPLDLRQKDEIGELAAEVNAMCDRLAEADARTKAETIARIETLEQLRHADRLITVGRLAAGIAHELGTPLNVIVGRTKMLRRGSLDPAVSSEYLAVVAEQAERITAIIRQLMDFARPREPRISAVDLRTIARSIAKLLAPMARKRNVSLTVTSHDSVLALGDAMQLEQVLSNLVVNAIQACEESGRVTISFGLGGTEGRTNGSPAGSGSAYLRVSDDGHGMDEATRSRIFEPFFTTKGVGHGTGLGLSVAHGIVEEHGGSISVSSEIGRGSTFSVVLPTVHG
ncbi:MAG TPA: HAMP domain-containing sensor histidine kinase [Polyangiaceae bacterium]